jgi:hypothetical protein
MGVGKSDIHVRNPNRGEGRERYDGQDRGDNLLDSRQQREGCANGLERALRLSNRLYLVT